MLIDLMQVIRRLFETRNMQLLAIEPPFDGLENFDHGLRKTLNPDYNFKEFGRKIVESMPSGALILTRDFVDSRYALFCLPDRADAAYLLGPWRTGPLQQERQNVIQAEFGRECLENVLEYHGSVQMADETQLVLLLMELLNAAYGENAFHVSDVPNFLPMSPTMERLVKNYWSGPSEISAASAEERNRLWDLVLNSVTQGDLEGAMHVMQQLYRGGIHDWTDDPLNNLKVYILSANANLCKAVTHSAVHPLYSEKIYNRYVSRLNEIDTAVECRELIYEMFQDYCTCVTQHALKDYSPLVQRVINHINQNLDASLSLKALAELCCISPSYLSNLFRSETGVTLTDYITRQRIQRAAFLLANGNDGIAQVGVQVGFLDDNYFTRTFKKIMGMPPTAYRKKHQQP